MLPQYYMYSNMPSMFNSVSLPGAKGLTVSNQMIFYNYCQKVQDISLEVYWETKSFCSLVRKNISCTINSEAFALQIWKKSLKKYR